MRAVNLLPADRRGGTQGPSAGFLVRQPLLTASVAVAVLAAVVLGFAAHSASSTVATRKDTLSRLDAQLAKLGPAKPATASADERSAASHLAVLSTVAGQRTVWDGFFSSLSRVLPEDVWLLNLSAKLPSATDTSAGSSTTPSTPAPASTSAPNDFTLTGYTYSQPAVARLMRRLELLPWLMNVSLATSTKSAIGKYAVYQFTVGANVVGLPGVGS